MSFIPSIARHAATAASHDISSSASGDDDDDVDDEENESVSDDNEEEEEEDAAKAAAKQESAKIEEETLKLKKIVKHSRPIYEDYLMPESRRASSESGSEPERQHKKARRRSNSAAESESEADRFRREIREEVQRELKAALNVKAEKVKQKRPEGGEATGSGIDRRSSGDKNKKSLSEKAITYKVEKPKQAKTGGGLSYKYQKQLATCVRQLVQLGDKINAIAQSADKRN